MRKCLKGQKYITQRNIFFQLNQVFILCYGKSNFSEGQREEPQWFTSAGNLLLLLPDLSSHSTQ